MGMRLMSAFDELIDPSENRIELVGQSCFLVAIEIRADDIPEWTLRFTYTVGLDKRWQLHRFSRLLIRHSDVRFKPVFSSQGRWILCYRYYIGC